MKISVVTITCREQPRFPEMLLTLAASFLRRTDRNTELEWIIVDEKAKFALDALDVQDLRWAFLQGAQQPEGFTVFVEQPLPSPHRQGDKVPAHNSARNSGLARATGDYVIFLNDCTIVTRDWVKTAEIIASVGKGWRVKAHVVNDLVIPADGVVKYRDHYDLLRPVAATSVPGACWGAPRAKLLEIGGFDLAYDGEDKGHDLDAVLRLERSGVAFVTTEQAFCVRLRRTKTQGEISTRKESFNGARNQKLVNDLLRDRDRIVPRRAAVAFGGPETSEDELAPPPAPEPLPVVSARDRARARAERARTTTTRGLPGGRRPARPGRDAAAVKPEGETQRIRPPLRPPTLPPPPANDEVQVVDPLDFSDLEGGDELDALEKELGPGDASELDTSAVDDALAAAAAAPSDPSRLGYFKPPAPDAAADESTTAKIDPDKLDELVERSR